MLTYLDDCGAPYMLVSKILFGKVKADELFIPSLILMRYMYFKSLKFRFYAPCKQALKAPSSPRNWGWWFVGIRSTNCSNVLSTVMAMTGWMSECFALCWDMCILFKRECLFWYISTISHYTITGYLYI